MNQRYSNVRLFADNETANKKSTNGHGGGNELDFLIEELVDSELDYLNDLRLCQNAYIDPLSASFDVSHIFPNWSKLIEKHESTLKRIHERCNGAEENGRLDYIFVFRTFQDLLSSIVDLYVDFCSRQNDAARQLEAKMASDIRFKQLVSDSQRKLRKLVENAGSMDGCADLDQTVERALRNSSLPLTTFLLKPMQRITKYGLLFDRLLNVVEKEQPITERAMKSQLESLKRSAQMLCNQVNEACRLKEDDQDNARRLRWCQSHIIQQQYGLLDGHQQQPTTRPYSISNSPLGSFETRLSADIIRCQSFTDSLSSSPVPLEQIHYDSNTNCLGKRRLVKSGTLIKLRSGRELVAFLFNDFLLLTQVKGGGSVRVEDVFRSERAQQAYYKHYRQPILLEDIQTNNFDNECLELQRHQHASIITCPSISAPLPANKDLTGVIVSFLDRKSGVIHNLIALSPKEKTEWDRLLAESVQKAREARDMYEFQNLLKASRRLSITDCFGRLFVTVLELVRITTPMASGLRMTTSADSITNSSWNERLSTSNRPDIVENLSIRLQLRLYKRTHMILDDNEKREVIPISDEFRTKPVVVCNATRQPTMVDMNESMSNLEIQRDVYKFDNDSTQFLLSSTNRDDGSEYLDIELVDDSRFRETRQLGRKRISMEQLLGRNRCPSAGGEGDNTNADCRSSNSVRNVSIRSGRGVQPLQPDRPVEMTLKLKTIVGNGQRQPNGTQKYSLSSAPAGGGLRLTPGDGELHKYNVKLRLHLQIFCDTNNLI